MPDGSYVKRKPWGQQKPLLGYGIDWGNDLSKHFVAEWLFNENSGMPHELVTNTKCASTPLWVADGLQISEHANRVDCDRNYDLAASEFTISLWLTLNTAKQYKVPFGIWNSANNARALQIVINGDDVNPALTSNIGIFTDATSLNYVWAPNSLQINKLHNITASFNGTLASPYLRYFVDGEEITTTIVATNGSGTRVPATGKWSIGSRYYTDLHIDGQIQHVSVFSKQFTSRMVATLYENPYCFIEGWNYGRSYSIPSSAFINSTYWYQNPIMEAI